jgi:Holliday junction resolvase RusA-like endonuclease
MKEIKLHFPIRVKPKQSGRISKGRMYKDSKLLKFEKAVKIFYMSQASLKSKFEGPVGLEVTYVFKHPKNWSRAKVQDLKDGKVYRPLRPDLTDNINKGWVDIVAPYLMKEDSQICEFSASKVYGFADSFSCRFYSLE